AEERTNDARNGVGAGDDTLPLGALGGWEEIGDDGHRQGNADASAEALYGAEHDEFRHRLRRTREQRTNQEDDAAAEQEPLASELVRKLAGDRRDDRRGQQVGRDDPGVAIKAL